MPHFSGLEFLEQLNPAPGVIFTTAYSEYALEGFELDIINYLLKPINLQRFIKASNKALRWLGKSHQLQESPQFNDNAVENAFIYLKSQDKMVKIVTSDIIAIESQGHYVKIYTSAKNHLIHQSISDMEERLPSELFQRTHQSYIIGLKHIKAFSSAQIETDKVVIPIGRSYKQVTMEKLNK